MGTTTANKKHATMTEAEVIQLLKDEQGDRSLRTFASEIGVTPGYVSDIYNGKRSPGPKVLKHFKIGKTYRVTTEYIFFRK